MLLPLLFAQSIEGDRNLEPERVAASLILHQGVPIVFKSESTVRQIEPHLRTYLQVTTPITISVYHLAKRMIVCGLLVKCSVESDCHLLRNGLGHVEFSEELLAAVIVGIFIVAVEEIRGAVGYFGLPFIGLKTDYVTKQPTMHRRVRLVRQEL